MYPIRDPRSVCVKTLVGFPFRFPKFVAEDAEESIVTAAEKDVAISGFEASVRYDRCCRR